MNFRMKLITFLGIPFLGISLISFLVIINVTQGKVEAQLVERLQEQERAIVRQIHEQVDTSAKGFLRASAESLSYYIDDLFLNNTQNPEDRILSYVSRMKIMDTGYIFVTDLDGNIIAHPDNKKVGTKAVLAPWISDRNASEFNDYEYEGRGKLAYKIPNYRLKWNFIVSSYVDEFSSTLDYEVLNETMREINIGASGYPFLINSDGIMVSHIDDNLLNKNALNIIDNDGNLIIERVFKEKDGSFSYFWKDPDGSIEEKFLFFDFEPSSKLYVCITGYASDFKEVITSITEVIYFFGAVMITICVTLLLFIARSVSKPLKLFIASLKDISKGEGDLTQSIEIKTSGEIAEMVSTFNGFLRSLQSLVGGVQKGVEKTVTIKEEVITGVEESAAALYQISSNLKEIQKLTKRLDDNVEISDTAGVNIEKSAEELDSSVENQSEMLQTSTAAITEMISSIDSVDIITTSKMSSAKSLLDSARAGAQVIEDTQNAVNEVNSKLDRIQEMANVISDISDRTNLLAMNAAIEAAHAGDAGRGFAVVADEIRKLAESSNTNSFKISESLTDISQSIITASGLSDQTMITFNELNTEIKGITDALAEINLSTRELKVGGTDIIESITGLENAFNTVKCGVVKIKELSAMVRHSMESTKDITLDVVTSIEEINNGVAGINESMNYVSGTTQELGETSSVLSESVGKFKT